MVGLKLNTYEYVWGLGGTNHSMLSITMRKLNPEAIDLSRVLFVFVCAGVRLEVCPHGFTHPILHDYETM